MSPNGNLLAIATSYTVHIAILPDSSHLGQIPNSPIKLKTYTIGPTSHVLSQSTVTNILWHPCGVGGNCLVTITADAVIRLWEFNREDRMSSADPALAIDLKKLISGTSEEDNFAPEKFQRNRGFSSDNVGLEVASACFGGTGSEDESGWSAMTLWIAMRSGDIYALCPLLPSKWQASVKVVPSLSTAAVAKEALKENGEAAGSEEERQCRDQFQWIQDVDGQESISEESDNEHSPVLFTRPSHPGPIPRLQGPFQIFPEDENEDLEFSDIHVIPSTIDPEEFMNDDELDSEAESLDEHALSATIVTLITSNGRVHVCLDLEGIEGQWLPRKKVIIPGLHSVHQYCRFSLTSGIIQPKSLGSPPKEPFLVVVEGLDTLTPTEQLDMHWPTFTADVNSRYSFFATHGNGVFFFSLDPWIERLEKELQNSEKLGAALRVDLIKNGPGTLRERVLSFDEDERSGPERPVPACLIFEDSDLGHFLLTSIDDHPEAVTFDEPDLSNERHSSNVDDAGEEDQLPEMSLLNLGPARTVYQPSTSFFTPSRLLKSYENSVNNRHRKVMRDEIRLSTVTLDVMTQAHRVLSQETHRLGTAASDLFRRCQRLRDELSDQVTRAREVAYRVEKITGEDADPYLDSIKSDSPPNLEDRLQKVRSRQVELADRYENLRKKFSTTNGRKLSEKERQWIIEVEKAQKSIEPPTEEEEDDKESTSELWHRCREVSIQSTHSLKSLC